MPIECRPSFGAMSSPGTGRSFSVAENERLRALARGMLEKVDNNQRRLADLLGVAQPTVSNFIAGKTGAGVQLATAIARQAGLSLQSATGGGDVKSRMTPLRPATIERKGHSRIGVDSRTLIKDVTSADITVTGARMPKR